MGDIKRKQQRAKVQKLCEKLMTFPFPVSRSVDTNHTVGKSHASETSGHIFPRTHRKAY